MNLNHTVEARKAVDEILRINPKYNLKNAKVFFGEGRVTAPKGKYYREKLGSYGVPAEA